MTSARADLDARKPMPTRRVRVTMEADARDLGSSLRLLIVPGGTVLVDPDWPGVTVEDISPERQWTDGDVVAWDDGHVFTRYGGIWVSPSHGSRHYDSLAAEALKDGGATLVRYQAGECE